MCVCGGNKSLFEVHKIVYMSRLSEREKILRWLLLSSKLALFICFMICYKQASEHFNAYKQNTTQMRERMCCSIGILKRFIMITAVMMPPSTASTWLMESMPPELSRARILNKNVIPIKSQWFIVDKSRLKRNKKLSIRVGANLRTFICNCGFFFFFFYFIKKNFWQTYVEEYIFDFF